MIGNKLSHYTIQEQIGAGGMGVVYRAWDERLERSVALKVLAQGLLSQETSRRNFRQEALALSRLNHPNIATVHDFDSHGDLDFIVMEYIEGQTLAGRIRSGPMPLDDILAVGTQIAAAIGEAHAHQVIHRDLKPGNIMISGKNRVKVLDFGLARTARVSPRADAETTMASDANVGGTLLYMAPEQVEQLDLDARVDIYAIGVILYEMALARHPYSEASPWKLAAAIMYADPPAPRSIDPNVPERLEGIIQRAMVKDRAARYQTVQELADDLRSFAGGSAAATSIPVTRSGPPSPRSVVALPARVFGSESDVFFTDALPATLSTYLSKVPGLETKAPPSGIDVERVGNDYNRIAAAYGVSTFVTSSVTTDGDSMVINVQLIEARSRSLLWSNEYHGPRLAFVQLARSAAQGICAAIQPAQTQSALKAVTHDPRVELLFRRGAYCLNLYVNRGRQPDFDMALGSLVEACEKDPGRADVTAALALLHEARFTFTADFKEALPQSEVWAKRTLDIDPRNGAGWAVLSGIERFRPQRSFRKWLECALKAAAFASDEAVGHVRLCGPLAVHSCLLGCAAAAEGSRLDPLSVMGPTYEALGFALLGEPDKARERLDYVFSIEPDSPIGVLTKFIVAVVLNEADGAAELFGRIRPLRGDRRIPIEWFDFFEQVLTFQQASRSGDAARADSTVADLVQAARGEKPFPRWQTLTSGIDGLLAFHGRTQEALDLLSFRAEHDLATPYDILVLNPNLETLRSTPEFRQVVIRSRNDLESMLLILEIAKAHGELPAYVESAVEELRRRTGFKSAASVLG